ncbi:MAG: AhpC/TSA family protein [Paludibacteraceae bacterium]|nr:AhpC/TSA family protein [Paludibacteraceae bacterium]
MKIRLYILPLVVLLLASCGKQQFRVSGTITDAGGDTLWLEQMALPKTVIIDSVVLPASGKFAFKAPRPEYPDLYRLRVGKAVLVMAVDSLDKITVKSDKAFREANIEGSEKTLAIQALRKSLREASPEDHKAFAIKQIMAEPKSMVAYYALFQQKAGLPVFDLFNKEDRKFYQAVATSFNTWMPGYYRSKLLHDQVIEVLNSERRAQNAAVMQAFIEESENAFLDITLPDEDGIEQSLSQYKGKVIVLDFASIMMDRYKGYLFEMKELYNAYHSRGVEFYEVYPDPNRLVWEDQVRALPWITVCTEKGLYDPVFGTYNIQALPTFFVYNKQGEIVGRFMDFESLRKALDKQVK